MLRFVPNTLTLANLFCGSLGCIFAIQGHLFLASQCLWIGAIFDFFDGLAARLLNAASPLGKQLDSLADMVTFGLLPGLLLYQLLSAAPAPRPSPYWPYWGLLVPLGAGFRLARFNISPSTTRYFVGLPTPANALLLSLLPHLSLRTNAHPWAVWLYGAQGLVAVAILCSWLPVSRLRFLTLKVTTLNWYLSWPQYLLALVAIPMGYTLHFTGAFISMLFYLCLSLLLQRRLRS